MVKVDEAPHSLSGPDLVPTRSGQLPNVLPVTSQDEHYLEFLRRSDVAVENIKEELKIAVHNRELGPGKWHPNGFATFEVKLVADLGLIRLHVWPKDHRRAMRGHPEIHNHSFQLFSRVIAGEYRESQYEVASPANDTKRKPATLSKYLVDLSGTKGVDTLIDTGESLQIVPVVSGLRFGAGSWHEVEVGKFHATPIPVRSFCATLAVLTPRVGDATDVLLGKPGYAPLTHARPSVDPDEAALIYSQLAEAGGLLS